MVCFKQTIPLCKYDQSFVHFTAILNQDFCGEARNDFNQDV